MGSKNTKFDRPQRAYVIVTEPGIGGGHIIQFPSSFSTADEKGIEIIRCTFETTIHLHDIHIADEDSFIWGITQLYTNGAPPAAHVTPGVVYYEKHVLNVITAVGVMLDTKVWSHEFSVPPVVHPASIYGFVQGFGAPAAITGYLSIDFRVIDLPPEDYKDILQSILIQNQI